ncbi:hypothetical protein FS837_007310 [Tulasnella sp. UAMH 9824]|nr:hypothetical protein FS837_007310 [Tulasnella sp. UAMH 9824]
MDEGPPNASESSNQKAVPVNYAPTVSPEFGDIDDFWKRYDELADKSDREMVANLNTNLDVLLIFAGLFSAVNTAFISAAMPNLSPNPSDRTNALLELLVLRPENSTAWPPETSLSFSPSRNSITANCFLYASLCCSIIAAVGAMLAKEWLQSYSRSGQAGPLEEQVRFRQGKYTAAQEWHLEVFRSNRGVGTKPVNVKDREQHIVNAQAANWLLEMTSSLEDQLTVAQNICCIDPTVCDILSLYPGIGDRLLSLTVEAIHTCQNQPSDKNLTIAEQFGTAFYHVMLCYPRNHELWNQLGQRLPVGSFQSRGSPILPELAKVLQGTGFVFSRTKQPYSLRKVILHHMIVGFHDQWTLEGRHTLRTNYDDAILSLLALQISLRIGKYAASMDIRIGQNLQNLATQAYMGANLDRNLADALPALASYIVSKRGHHFYDRANAAFICVAFLERIKLSIDRRALSPLLEGALCSCLPELLSGFGAIETHDTDVVRLSTVVIGCFRALEQVRPGKYDGTTIETVYNTLQYAVVAADRNHELSNSTSLTDYLLESLEWAGILRPSVLSQNASWTGVGKYPRIVARMASSLKASHEPKRSRWITLIHNNLNELLHRRSLRVWEDAELGSHAVDCLRKAASNYYLTPATDIIRRLIWLSVDCSTELLAAKIVDAIAEVSKTVIQWPQWALYSRQAIYMELLDLILKVWNANLRVWSVRSVNWPTNSTLNALRILLPHVDKRRVLSRDSKATFSNLPTLPLMVDYLMKRKPETAFIARNLDVSLNCLLDTPERRFGWSYRLYTDQKHPMLCSQTVHIDNKLL